MGGKFNINLYILKNEVDKWKWWWCWCLGLVWCCLDGLINVWIVYVLKICDGGCIIGIKF